MDAQQIKRNVNLLDVISRDTQLRKVATTNGGEFAGPCPFCGGRDRFRVQPVKGLWWCRQCCDKWGDVITYVMRRDAVDFKTACAMLGGVALSSDFKPAAPAQSESRIESPNPRWQARAESLVQWAIGNLWSEIGSRAIDWLLARGLNADMFDIADLGYIPRDMFETLDAWGLRDGGHKSVYIPRGILIPCRFSGLLWYLNVRRPVGDPKYIKVLGSVRAFYAPFCRREHDTLCLTEGEFDMLLLRQECGDLVDAGTLGSASIKRVEDNWLPSLSRYKTILACHDDDHDGNVCAEALTEFSPNVRRLRPIGGKDVTEMYQRGGDLRAWVQAALAFA